MRKTIDELLQTPYWVLDILPRKVPKDSPGQYFTIADYFLQEPQLTQVKRRHLSLILKLNCYRDISLDEEEPLNPPPERLAAVIRSRYTFIRFGESMLLSEPDDTHMTLFNPDPETLALIGTLAVGEGLYLWQPPQ